MPLVFISHIEEDQEIAGAVASGLEHAGHRAWLYERDALPGPSYLLQTARAIEEAAAVILLVSANALRSHQMTREVVRAHELARPLVPVLLDVPHERLVREQPEWAQALGASTSVRVRPGEIDIAVPRIVAGLERLGVATRLEAPGQGASPVAEATFTDLVGDPSRLVQRRVDRYLVREFLGAGGSGLVYQVRDERLGRDACLKLFYPVAAEHARAAEIVAAGARALGALRHPDIVEVWDFGSTRIGQTASFFLVMNLVHGIPLDDWSRAQSGAGAFAARLRVATRVAAALSAAHTCRYFDPLGFERVGVLHGDLKPANVLVRPDGGPTVLDFTMVDLRRLLDDRVIPREFLRGDLDAPITLAMGTPGFMAPEQERDGVVTVQTDIYGLGATLARVFSLDADAPATLAALISRMTARSSEGRPASMAEVVDALRALGA